MLIAARSLPPSYKVTLRDAPASLLMVAPSRGVGGEALPRSCISQKILFLCPEMAEDKLPISGPCCAPRLHLFSSGAWQIGQFAITSLSWEVVTHPSRQLLPKVIHHRVSSKSSLVSFYGSESKERHVQGREEQIYMSWCHTLKRVFFSGCVTPGEHPPHPHCAGTGVAQYQACWAQSTGTSLELTVPSLVPLGATGYHWHAKALAR